MWTILVFICLVSSFDISCEASLENVNDVPVRLPRRFLENSRTRRLHIKNQTGFDGKVDKIHINSEEDHPGIQAYGLPSKHLTNNGQIERVHPEVEEHIEDGVRSVRSVEAYGKSKDRLENNGKIVRIQPHAPSSYQVRQGSETRVARSIDTEPKQETRGAVPETEEMEAQDAKVFRPLFVYRQQLAKKQHRANNQFYGYRPNQNIYYERRVIY